MPKKRSSKEVVEQSELTPIVSLETVKNEIWKYERLSASMMKTWLQCKRKFFFNYIQKQISEPSEALSLGTAFHEAMEECNKFLKNNPKTLNKVEIEYYVQVFRDRLAKLFLEGQKNFEIGETLVRQELSSHSHEKVFGIEEEFDLITPEGVRIYGFIDKLVEEPNNVLRIIDYKTSVMPLSYEEARLDEQLSMYDLAMQLKYPEFESRILELRYVRTGESLCITKNQIEQQNFRRRLLAVDKAIKEYVSSTKEPSNGDLNQFCTWCSYKRSCPTYVQHMNTLLPSFPNIEALEDTSFIEMWEKVAAIDKAAKSWKEALKIWALQRIEAFPEVPIDNGIKQIYTISSVRREYDPSKIGKIIGIKDLLGASTNGEPLVNVNNKALETLLKCKDDRKLEAKVEEAVTVKFNSPQIRIKKS